MQNTQNLTDNTTYCITNKMFKIIIVAYLIGNGTLYGHHEFTSALTFNTLNDCKAVLTKKNNDNGYVVVQDFIIQQKYLYDWVHAECTNDNRDVSYKIEPGTDT